MTKEAKLQAAMRILPEWTSYDEEIKALQKKIENENKQLEKEDKEDKEHTGLFLIIKNFQWFIVLLLNFLFQIILFFILDDVAKHEEL